MGEVSLRLTDFKGLNLDSLKFSSRRSLPGVEKVTFLFEALKPEADLPLYGLVIDDFPLNGELIEAFKLLFLYFSAD